LPCGSNLGEENILSGYRLGRQAQADWRDGPQGSWNRHLAAGPFATLSKAAPEKGRIHTEFALLLIREDLQQLAAGLGNQHGKYQLPSAIGGELRASRLAA